MAKSKKRSKKASKANKTHKSNKAKKLVSQQKRQAVKATELKAERLAPVWKGLIAAILIAIVLAAVLISTADDKSIKGVQSSANPTTNPNSQQTIKVTEPNAKGTPEATGYQLQGSAPDGQQSAQGGLQKPQTSEQLQPNARIQNYENAELN